MLKLYDKNLLTEDLTSDTLVYLYFSLPGCGPCKRISPLVKEYAEKSDTIVYDLKVEDDPDLTRSLQIRLYPTLVGVKNTETVFIAEGSNQILEKLV